MRPVKLLPLFRRMKRQGSGRADKLLTMVLVFFVGAQLVSVLKPGGSVNAYLVERAEQRRLSTVIDALWESMAAGSSTFSGEPGGQPAIVELADYECPYCRQQHEELVKFAAANPSIVVGFLHTPLAFHAAAEGAARSVICAEQQGRFRQLHDRFFETDQWIADTNWVGEAQAAGVADLDAFTDCLQSDGTGARLDRDAAIAERLGSRGTPTLLNRRELHYGVLRAEQLEGFASK